VASKAAYHAAHQVLQLAAAALPTLQGALMAECNMPTAWPSRSTGRRTMPSVVRCGPRQ
jgi:hypothetical protein